MHLAGDPRPQPRREEGGAITAAGLAPRRGDAPAFEAAPRGPSPDAGGGRPTSGGHAGPPPAGLAAVPWRGVLAASGAGLALALWLVPLAAWMGVFEAHMLRHALLVAVVPAAIAPVLPARGAPPLALGAVLEAAAAWGWHMPGPHLAAILSPVWRVAEQGSFLLAGLLVWWGALAARPLAGTGALLLTSIHMTMLGAAITLAPRVLYPYSDLASQQAGAILMLAVVTPAYLLGGLAIARRALREDPA